MEQLVLNEGSIIISFTGRNLHIEGASQGELFLLDSVGKIVYQQKMSQSRKLTIPTKIKSGDYVAMVKQDKDFNTQKITLGP